MGDDAALPVSWSVPQGAAEARASMQCGSASGSPRIPHFSDAHSIVPSSEARDTSLSNKGR